MKTIIHVYTNNCYNIIYDEKKIDTYWGLGDILRGTIKLYQLSEILNFNLIVDFQLHPISKYLELKNHIYQDIVLRCKDNIVYYEFDKLEDSIINFLNSDKSFMLLNTNDKIINDFPITENCRIFIKDLLKPKPEFQEFILKKLNQLPFRLFNIVHIRFSDNFQNKEKIINKIDFFNYYKDYIKILKQYTNKNYIIISDNEQFKSGLKKYYSNYYISDSKVCHLGKKNNKEENIRDTLAEFFLISYSQSIKTYSFYYWTSGYVERIHQIYNIPLENIPIENITIPNKTIPNTT